MTTEMTATLEAFSTRIGLPMIYSSAGRAACGRVVRDATPKIDLSKKALRACVRGEIEAVGIEMARRAARIIGARMSVDVDDVRNDIEAEARAAGSAVDARRLEHAIWEIIGCHRDHAEGTIVALTELAAVLGR